MKRSASATCWSNTRPKVQTLRRPKPTTVTTMSSVVVRIILTLIEGPCRLSREDIARGNLTDSRRMGQTTVPSARPMDALLSFIASFKQMSDALIDSCVVVYTERNIVDFNRAFFGMLPRNVARGLKGKKCYEVLELNICKERCIAHQCW